MAFLIGGANTESGDLITNSLRFNGSNAYLNRTTSTASGNTKLTISFWTKGHSTGSSDVNYHFVKFDDTNNRTYLGMWDREIRFYQTTSGSAAFYYQTQSNAFADAAAWYHFCLIVDTTDGTAGDRIKLYVNGTRYTDWQTETQPSQNTTLRFATDTSTDLHIGRYADSTDYYFDGYMAEIHYIDGQDKAASDFAETDDNGVWVPKKYTGTYGDEGFYLQFKETGSSANASGKGADTSGNGNHFDDNNMDAYDITTDTPNNNFATLNPLISKENGANTYSEGNCKISTSADDYASGVSTIGVSKGKWYYEVKLISTGGTDGYTVGITADPNEDARLDVGDGNHAPLGNKAWSYGLNSYGTSSAKAIALNSGSEIDSNDSWAYQSGNDIQMVALDMDNNKLYFGENGTWGNSSDPTSGSTGTGAVDVSTSYDIYFVGAGSGNNSNSTVFELNFGNPPFSISSGNADANGYGNFEYAPPSGYYALCTKNLAEYG